MSKLLLFFGVCLFVCSCSTAKFDFNTAYNFSRYNYQQEQQEEHTVEEQEQEHIYPPELQRRRTLQGPSFAKASDGKHTGVLNKSESENMELYPPVASLRSLPPHSPVNHPNGKEADLDPVHSSPAITRDSYEKATKAEKKAIREQVKQEYKSLRQEIKKAKKEAATQDIVFSKKMYIGLVIFAAGLLVAILASGPVGAIGIIVGIGLIAWGFIEQA